MLCCVGCWVGEICKGALVEVQIDQGSGYTQKKQWDNDKGSKSSQSQHLDTMPSLKVPHLTIHCQPRTIGKTVNVTCPKVSQAGSQWLLKLKKLLRGYLKALSKYNIV